MVGQSRMLLGVFGLALLGACSSESEQSGGSPSADAGATSSGGSAGAANAGNAAGAGTGAGGGAGTGGESGSGGDPGSGGSSAAGGSAPTGGAGGSAPLANDLTVELVPQAGVAGTQRINFAIPLVPGQLGDDQLVVVSLDGAEIAAARRGLAQYPDGSWRSVQIQVDVDLSGTLELDITLGAAPQSSALSLANVADTLDPADGTAGPQVWVLLPAGWLSTSGVAGPMLEASAVAGTDLGAWDEQCDYVSNDVEAFLSEMTTAGVWLFDRGTALYRGYAATGALGPLESAYRETSIYRGGLTGTGVDTRIGVPDRIDDLKYHYTQNLAIHYLLTGDDRFREAAEDVGERAASLWTSPGYAGGADFWTERHAGFGLLAYVWAGIVSDDQADQFWQLADDAVTAYLEVQETYPSGYTDPDARCFAHSADAHGEGYGYFGCSPWMSAILADGLDQYATERGGAPATAARESIVKLARAIIRDGLDATGKPFYWMGLGTDPDEIDAYDEHWGESAYIAGMAWYHAGGADAELRGAADELVAQFRANASMPHLRSFNWQCRSAVATPWFLSQ